MSNVPLSPAGQPIDSLPMAPRPVRLWFWALVLCLILVVIALVFLLNLYNATLALNSEKLDAAKQRWRMAGIRDYNLHVTVRGRTAGDYYIRVRNGAVADGCTMNNQELPPEQARMWTVDALLEEILARELESQKMPEGANCYSQVEFDENNGHPKRYLRVVNGESTDFSVRLITDLSQPAPSATAGGVRGAAGAAGANRPRPSRTRPAASTPTSPASTPTTSAGTKS